MKDYFIYRKALNLTKKYGQEHLLAFWNEIDDSQKEQLLESVKNTDFELVMSLYKMAQSGEKNESGEIKPIGVTVQNNLSEEKRKAYRERGLEIMKNGQFASVTMAGGQGTRLGHQGPKGTYNIDVPGADSLFEIQANRLKRKSEKCGHSIPWYIMTSRENNDDTVKFFEENDYFGYPKEDVMFFRQFMLPMIDFSGRIVLEDKWKIKEGADGHGGIFRAMAANGVIEDMVKRGVKWAFIGGIDNVLVKLCDEEFAGFLDTEGYPIGGKSLIKRDPYEKAGVFCLKDGLPFVVEYTEVSKEMAEMTDSSGEFVYGDAHILCNMFGIEALKSMKGKGLPYHVAVKKTAYIDADGNKITPEKPNAYKFEAFIFDAFSMAGSMGIYRVSRENEFAPVKNKEGEDSPETARAMYLKALENGTCD